MANVGYASLSIIPVAKGFQGQLSSAVGPGVQAAGRSSGKKMGEAIADGLDQAKASVQKASDGLAKARGKEEDASNKVRVAELKLQEVRDSGRSKASTIEAAEGRLAKAKRDAATASKGVESAETSLTTAQDSLTKATDKSATSTENMGTISGKAAGKLGSLGESMARMPGPLGAAGAGLVGVSDKMSQMGESSNGALLSRDNMKKFAAGAAVAAVGVTTALYNIGSTFDEMSAKIRVGTGATGDELAGLEDVATRISTSIPVSFGEAGDAVTTLSTATGASGDSLEHLSEQVLNTSRLLGEDASTNAEQFGKVINQWSLSADEGADAMDGLFKVTQDYGTSFSGMTNQLNQYGSVLQNAGFSMEDSAVLFGKLEKSGLSVSRIMPGLNKAFRDWAAEGKDVKASLTGQIDAIKNAETSTEALAIATESFGAEGAQRLTTGIRNGSFAIDDLAGSLGDASGTIAETDEATRTISDSFQILKNKGLDAIRGPATKVFDVFTSGVTAFTDFASNLSGLTGLLKVVGIALAPMAGVLLAVVGAVKAWSIAQAALNFVMNQNPIVRIGMLIAGLVAGVIYAYQNFETFRNIVDAAWEGIKTAVSFAWHNVIQPVFNALSGFITGIIIPAIEWLWHNVVQPAFAGIGTIITGAWNTVIKPAWDALTTALGFIGDTFTFVWQNVIEPVWNALGDGIRWVWEKVVSPAWEAMKDGLGFLQDSFGTAVDWIGKVWDTIKGIVAKPIRFVVETVYNNGIVAAWNKVASWLPGVDPLEKADLGELANYADGGIHPGYTPGRDIGFAAVSGGEAIMRPEWTNAMGPDYVHGANAAARAGGTGGVRKFLGAYADGGIVDGLTSWVKERFPGMTMTSGYRPGDPGYHGQGMAADFSNSPGNTGSPEEMALAQAIAEQHGGATLELIHANGFANNIKDGQSVGDGIGFYGAGTMSGHRNHVHWAMDHAPDSEGGGGVLGWIKDAAGAVVSSLRSRVAGIFDAIMNPIGDAIPDFGGGVGAIPKAFFETAKDSVRSFIVGEADNASQGPAGSASSAGAEQWRGAIVEALAAEGFPTTDPYVEASMAQIMTESGGDPMALQGIQDVNSGGNEAQGLVQVTPDTAAAMGLAELGGNVFDPVTNLRLGMRWLRQGHGGDLLGTWGHGHGYRNGGEIVGPGTGTSDSIPLMGSDGEFLVNADAAAKNRGLLEAVNSGQTPDIGLGDGESFDVFVTNWPDNFGAPAAAPAPSPATSAAPTDAAPADTTTPEATAVNPDDTTSLADQARSFFDDNQGDIAETLLGLGLGITVNNYGSNGTGAWKRAADRRQRKVRLSNR